MVAPPAGRSAARPETMAVGCTLAFRPDAPCKYREFALRDVVSRGSVQRISELLAAQANRVATLSVLAGSYSRRARAFQLAPHRLASLGDAEVGALVYRRSVLIVPGGLDDFGEFLVDYHPIDKQPRIAANGIGDFLSAPVSTPSAEFAWPEGAALVVCHDADPVFLVSWEP